MAQAAEKTATWRGGRPNRRQSTALNDVDRYVSLRIRQRRIMLSLTQQQVGDLIGVSDRQAHKYEAGMSKITAGRLYQIAQALGVDVGYFYEDVDPQVRSRTGPLMFVAKIKEIWRLEEKELAKLLGFDEERDVIDLICGVRKFNTRDTKDRVRELLQMREALHGLFRNIDAEREWLREARPEPGFEGRSALAWLLEGSMANLLMVSQFVQRMVGR